MGLEISNSSPSLPTSLPEPPANTPDPKDPADAVAPDGTGSGGDGSPPPNGKVDGDGQGSGGGSSGGSGSDDDSQSSSGGTDQTSSAGSAQASAQQAVLSGGNSSSNVLQPTTSSTSSYFTQVTTSAAGQSVAFLNASINADMQAQNALISQTRFASQEQGAAAQNAASAAINMASHQAEQTKLQADESFTQAASGFTQAGVSAYQMSANTGEQEVNKTEYANNSTSYTKSQVPDASVQPKSYTEAVAKANAAPAGSPEATPPNRSDYHFSEEELKSPPSPSTTPSGQATNQAPAPASGPTETPPEDEEGGIELTTFSSKGSQPNEIQEDEPTPIGANQENSGSTVSQDPDEENLADGKIETEAHDGIPTTGTSTAPKTPEEKQIDADIHSLITTGRLPDPAPTERGAYFQKIPVFGSAKVDTTQYPSDSEIKIRTDAAFAKMTPSQRNEAIAQAQTAHPQTEANYKSAVDTRNAASQRTSSNVTTLNALFSGFTNAAIGVLKGMEASQQTAAGAAQAAMTLYNLSLSQMGSVLSQTLSLAQSLASNQSQVMSTYASILSAGRLGG